MSAPTPPRTPGPVPGETRFPSDFESGPDPFVPLDSVGGCTTLVRADVHREGALFAPNYLVGASWQGDGYDGLESEGGWDLGVEVEVGSRWRLGARFVGGPAAARARQVRRCPKLTAAPGARLLTPRRPVPHRALPRPLLLAGRPHRDLPPVLLVQPHGGRPGGRGCDCGWRGRRGARGQRRRRRRRRRGPRAAERVMGCERAFCTLWAPLRRGCFVSPSLHFPPASSRKDVRSPLLLLARLTWSSGVDRGVLGARVGRPARRAEQTAPRAQHAACASGQRAAAGGGRAAARRARARRHCLPRRLPRRRARHFRRPRCGEGALRGCLFRPPTPPNHPPRAIRATKCSPWPRGGALGACARSQTHAGCVTELYKRARPQWGPQRRRPRRRAPRRARGAAHARRRPPRAWAARRRSRSSRATTSSSLKAPRRAPRLPRGRGPPP
jgi:hypothetical protein